MTMQSIKEKVLEEFKKNYGTKCVIHTINGGQEINYLIDDGQEQFLSDSIKEAYEEGVKDKDDKIKDFILNRDNCSLVKQCATINDGVVQTFLYDGDLILKSLNKEDKYDI